MSIADVIPSQEVCRRQSTDVCITSTDSFLIILDSF